MVNESQSSNRRLIILLAIGALALAVVAGVLIVALVLGGNSGAGVGDIASTKLMPKDSFIFTALNPHLDQAKNYAVLEKAWVDNPTVQKGLGDLLSSMGEEGLDYKADIEPWLGDEVAFSMGAGFLASMGTSIQQSFEGIEGALGGDLAQPSAGSMPDVPEFIITAATTNSAASDQFLAKLRSMAEESGEQFQETDYKGIKIVYTEPQSEHDPGMAYATVDDLVVIAVGGLEPMQAAIDARDGDNLSDNQAFKDVVAKLPADQILYGYVDTRAYMDVMLEAVGPGLAGLPADLFNPDQLEAIKGVGYSAGLESDGLRIDFVSTYDKDALSENMFGSEASSEATAGRVPADTLFYASGSGLGSVIQMGLDAVKAMPEAPEDLDEQLQMFTGLLGVSLDDLVKMMSGEFAIAVAHDPAGFVGDPSTPVGVSFLMAAEEEENFQKLINSVSSLLTLSGDMDVGETTVNDVAVTTLPDPMSGNMIAGWGVGQGFFAIGTSQKMLEAAFGGGGDKLSDADIYKTTVARLPDERSGVFFMNLSGLLGVVEDAMGPGERASFEEARAVMGPVKAMAAASEPLDPSKDSATGTLFIFIETE